MATTLGQEITFGLDNFKQPKMLSMKDTAVQILLNIFFSRKGNFPSMPNIGIDINSYMYKLDGDFDPEEIKSELYNQCAMIASFITLGDVRVFITTYKGQQVLIVSVPIVGLDETGDSTVLFGFMNNGSNGISSSVQIQAGLINQ